MNSPVRLGIFPTASIPTGVFTQRFEALFPWAGALSFMVCFAPQLFFVVFLHANVGLPAPPAAISLGPPCWPGEALSAPLHNLPPHQVHQLLPCCKSSLPSCLYPPLLLVWMNVSSLTPWFLEFPTVQFSVSSYCFCFFNLLLSFWLCEEAQCVFLCLHLGQKS